MNNFIKEMAKLFIELNDANPVHSVIIVSEIEKLYDKHIKDLDDKPMSAFAFKVGRQVEDIIKDRTNNLEFRNQTLEAKILSWYYISKDEGFADYFKIDKRNDKESTNV